MFFRDFWNCLYYAYYVVTNASPEQQDEAINALFRFLDNRRNQQFPSLLCEQAIQISHWYLDRVLPALEYEEQDRQDIARHYKEFLEHLKTCSTASQKIEKAFERLIEQIRNGTFTCVHEVAEALSEIARDFFHLQDLQGFQKPFRSDHLSQQRLQSLRNSFRYDQAAAFFKDFFNVFLKDSHSSSSCRLAIHNFTNMFEYVLDSYFHAKAVLIDPFRHGQIMPLWVTVDADKTSEHVEFWNQNIDPTMQESADIARDIARQYLMNEYERNIPKKIFVQCQFPHFDVSFKDTSASLLLGIRIIEEVLGVKSKPATVITGGVGRTGEIPGVGFINEKIEAAKTHTNIERILIPEANIPELSSPGIKEEGGIRIVSVQTFAEAVQQVLDHHREDWGEAPDVDEFYDREEKLEEIQHWTLHEHCRLVAIWGMGGIGKTTLARKLIDQIKNRFQYIFWRDLRNAPPVKHILGDCIKFLSDQQRVNLPEETDRVTSLLITYLKKHRCLLVLDNMETLLQGGGGDRTGLFLKDYEDYGIFIQRVGEIEHQSCLILTSREKPKDIGLLEGKTVRSLPLQGLEPIGAENFLKDLSGTKEERTLLIHHYAGHPLALKLVSATIQDVFHRNITTFFAADAPLFISIKALLEQQYKRLSKREQEVMYWLAIEREAVSLLELQGNMVSPVSRKNLPITLESLQQKSLIEKTTSGFTLQPVVLEYFTELIIEQVCKELATGTISLLNSHALMKAQAKDYIRQSQIRLIFKPIIEHLLYEYELDKQQIAGILKKILSTLRENHPQKSGYAGGNALNLLIYLKQDLTGWDFSHLAIQQAYLQDVDLYDVNFAYADFIRSVFTETFGNVLSVAFSPDGRLLAAGTTSNEIRIWETKDGKPLLICKGHSGWIWSIAFSPDGKTLASGSQDQTIRLWDVSTGQSLKTLQGHSDWVWSLAFNPNGHLLASGSDDCTARIWDVHTGQLLNTFQEHTNGVHAVAFSPDGKTLASGSADQTIRFWNMSGEHSLNTEMIDALQKHNRLIGHTDRVRTVIFSPDGQSLASGGDDQTVRIWDLNTKHCIRVLRGHTNIVKSVAFSPNSHTLASGSDDCTIRIWDIHSGQCLKTLQEHTTWVWSVAFAPDDQILASGGSDQTIRLWDVYNGQCLKTLHGYTIRATSAVFSPDGRTLACGYSDATIRLWNIHEQQCLRVLRGHKNWIMSVAFNPDGKTLASASSDYTIRVWDFSTGKCLKLLEGHTDQVRSVAFNPDGNSLLSGSYDRTLRVWNLNTGQCSSIFEGHTDWILSIALSSDGKIFASGSEDQTIRFWDVHTRKCLNTLEEHTGRVWSIAFNPDGSLLASSSGDQSIRIWDVRTGECLKILNGHSDQVRSIAFSPDGQILVSGGKDQTLRLWNVNTGESLKILQEPDKSWIWSVTFNPNGRLLASANEDGTTTLWNVQTGECLHTLKPDRPYERMNITETRGLNEAQKATLRALGAVEDLGYDTA